MQQVRASNEKLARTVHSVSHLREVPNAVQDLVCVGQIDVCTTVKSCRDMSKSHGCKARFNLVGDPVARLHVPGNQKRSPTYRRAAVAAEAGQRLSCQLTQ